MRGAVAVLGVLEFGAAPSATLRRGSWAPAVSDCSGARVSPPTGCRGRIAPKLAGGSAIVCPTGATASDAAGESARAARSRSISDRNGSATGPRSPPARDGLRRRGIAWPARAPNKPAHDVGLEASGREQRRLHGDRFELLARAARRRRRRPCCRPSTPVRRARRDATATVRPASADASSPSRCGPSPSAVVEPVSTAPRHR